MPLNSVDAAPVFGHGNPPQKVGENIYICEQTYPHGASVFYAPEDIETAAAMGQIASDCLSDGKVVAVKGPTAMEFVNRYLA